MPDSQTGATPATSSATPEPNSQANPEPTWAAAPSTNPPASSAPPPPATGDDEPLGEPGRRALEDERQKRRDAEKRAKDAEKKAADLEAEKLTDDEKRNKRLAELEASEASWNQERRQLRIEQGIARLAGKLKLVDVETVARLVDPAKVTFDDSGSPTNIEEVVTAIVTDKPFLATTAAPPPPPAGGINAGDGLTSQPPPNLTADELAAAKAAGMDPAKYAALRGKTTLGEWQASQPKTT